jgi:hypothetical protein
MTVFKTKFSMTYGLIQIFHNGQCYLKKQASTKQVETFPKFCLPALSILDTLGQILTILTIWIQHIKLSGKLILFSASPF